MDLYILGAGFSNDAGVPTMKNFLRGLEEVRAASFAQEEKALLDRALGFARLQNEGNIEKLLAFAHNSSAFFDLTWAFGLTINHFSLKFLNRCRSGSNLDWYECFCGLLCHGDAKVLTFNYDMVLEEVLWRRSLCHVNYGLSFDREMAQPDFSSGRHPVELLKLHGSVSFLWCLACHYLINHCGHALNTAFEQALCPQCGSRLVPLLVPPTYQKAIDFAPVLNNLWLRADLLLKSAGRLIVGGMSFASPDTDFRDRLRMLAGLNRQLKEVVIINRDMEICRATAAILPAEVPCRFVPGFAEYCRE